MNLRSLLSSMLIGAVASARSMTPMATIAAARLAGRHTTGQLVLLDRPVFKAGALLMGAVELYGDKMTTAPDRTVFLGLLACAAGLPDPGRAQESDGDHRPDQERPDRGRADRGGRRGDRRLVDQAEVSA